ncbi:MAG: helix-turn-helix domain-containing protein [Hyphomicrobiales bacterium]|nr:helix-turn-helix domain-containing protein [Hyphomicrobiales bacterium]
MSAGRILQIMKYVASREKAVTVKDIAEHLKIPGASAHRLINALEKEDVLERNTSKGIVKLSNNFLRSMIAGASNEQIVARFKEALVCTVKTWNASAFLGRLNGEDVEIVRTITPPDERTGFIHPGLNTRPIHACSSARGILAFQPEDKIDEVLDRNFQAFADKTITGKSRLREELRLTKERGYAMRKSISASPVLRLLS